MGNLQIPVLNEEESKHLPKGVDFECIKILSNPSDSYAIPSYRAQETNGQQKARLTCIQMSVINKIHVTSGNCFTFINPWKKIGENSIQT